MCELNSTSRIPTLNLEIPLQDTKTLSCKPSKLKTNEGLFLKPDKLATDSSVPTQNSDSLSDIEAFQESPLKRKQAKESIGADFDKEAFEVRMEAQRKVILETFDSQMAKRMEEMDKRVCRRWEEAVVKMHEKYEQKVEKYGEALKDIQVKSEQDTQKRKTQLEQQLNEKYHNEYLDKLESVNDTFKNENPDKLLQVVCKAKAKLEMDCEEKYALQVLTKREEIKQETEQIKKDQYNQTSNVNLTTDINKKQQSAHEATMASLIVENQKDINSLRKSIRELQQGHGYERIKAELLEDMRREYIVKEEEMNKQLREKLITSKKEADNLVEQQRTRRLSQERPDANAEKKRSESVRDNSRVKKAEEANKELAKKLAEREEKYLETIDELRKELDNLKVSRGIPLTGRLSTRNTSRERKSVQQQRNSVRSIEKPRGSYDPSLGESSGAKNSTVESANRPVSARSRREAWDSERRKAGKGVGENASELMKSCEVKKNLTETLMKENMTAKQTPCLSQYFQPFSTERTAKALMQMLSPTTSSEIQYFRAESRLESMQGPVSEATKNTISVVEQTCEVKEIEVIEEQVQEEIMVTPQKAQHRRSASGLMSERGQQMDLDLERVSLFEDMLRQRDSNSGVKAGSFTERRLDMKEQETDRSSKNTERTYTTRYEELLKRQRSGSKKRGGSISHRKENIAGIEGKSSKKQGAMTKRNVENQENALVEKRYSAKSVLRNVFEIRENDDEETKAMKILKKAVEEQISENDLLASKCHKKEVDLCVNFPWRTSIQSIEQERILQDKLKTLFELWRAVEISNVARLAFMEDLERLIRYDDIIQKITAEINQVAQLATETEPITKLLTWRGQLRDQIKGTDFSYDIYEKICFALENNNKELREALEYYQMENGKLVQFKGVDLREIIRVDQWENEYLRSANSQLNGDYRLQQKV